MYSVFLQSKKGGETRLPYSPLINKENASIKEKSARDAAFAKEVNRNQKSTGVNVSGLSTVNGAFGTAVAYGEASTLAGQGKYITSKGLIRDINPTKLTAHSKPYANAGKILKGWSRASAVIGVAVDSYAWWNNQISGTKFGVNTTVSAWGLGVGAAGMAMPAFIGGAAYYGIDTFYPGGFGAAMQMNASLVEQNQKILGPKFNLYKDF
jgi:hypothetical protein